MEFCPTLISQSKASMFSFNHIYSSNVCLCEASYYVTMVTIHNYDFEHTKTFRPTMGLLKSNSTYIVVNILYLEECFIIITISIKKQYLKEKPCDRQRLYKLYCYNIRVHFHDHSLHIIFKLLGHWVKLKKVPL